LVFMTLNCGIHFGLVGGECNCREKEGVLSAITPLPWDLFRWPYDIIFLILNNMDLCTIPFSSLISCCIHVQHLALCRYYIYHAVPYSNGNIFLQ
jgi:hypothetical protein